MRSLADLHAVLCMQIHTNEHGELVVHLIRVIRRASSTRFLDVGVFWEQYYYIVSFILDDCKAETFLGNKKTPIY